STNSAPEDTLLNYIVASYYGLRQAIFFMIAPVIVGVITYFPYEFIRRRSTLFYYFACGLLLVALAGKAAGVKAWIDIIWGYTLQPSEFVKLACIIVTAKYLETNTDPLGSLRSFVTLAILMGVPWALTLAQGEMGSVLVMIFVFGVMLYFGGIRLRIMGGILATAVIGIALLYGIMISTGSDNYRLERILSFINPALVDESAVYQVTQSKIAIGSGGLHGIGIFVPGSFSQLDYVPEDWTDFIFSTIGEAFGFVGCGLVVLMYLLIILRMLFLARYTVDRFGQMVIIGVMAMMLFHVFENVGMTTGLMPVTGIPLPFLSYGGSNLVTNMAGVGLVLNVIKNRSITTMPGLAPQTTLKGKYYR
ncbi:MAG: FtsW/RodA/SpoVE family cell cycle protein, partial [Clostridia bacterium]